MSTPQNKIIRLVPLLHRVCEKVEMSVKKLNDSGLLDVSVHQIIFYVTPEQITDIFIYSANGLGPNRVNFIYLNTELKYMVSPGNFWYTQKQYCSLLRDGWDHVYGRFYARNNILVYVCR